MTEYYDELETRGVEAREQALMGALPGQVALAKHKAPAYAKLYAEADPAAVTNRAALAGLPVLRKAELGQLQAATPPFGGLTATPVAELARLYLSPGPIADPQGQGPDWWRMGRALFAAGFRAGDVVHNCFSYHFTPAGAMLDSAAQALGCVVFPGGIGQTELQVEAMVHFRPDGYVGTPDFLMILLDKAAETGADIASLKKALVGGGALPPSLRHEIAGRGVSVLQCYATADLGSIAYESEAREGMILDEHVIVEIVRPGTGDPVPDGDVGEVVVTTLNPDYPLIRFGTGDLSAILPGASPCGRTAPRIKGWLGRADQATKVRGMFVHPEQVAAVLGRHGQVIRGRLTVSSRDNQDVMTLACEVDGGGEALAHAIAESLRTICKLRGQISLVAPGSLPNDGKVIEDQRSYE